AHNAPLHLFSASPELVGFGGAAYRRRSEQTSRVLGELLKNLRSEGFTVAYTMEDFNRQYVKKYFARLTPEERREALQSLPPEQRREVVQSLPPEQRREVVQSLPPEQRLEGLSEEQIQQYLERLRAGRPAAPRKSRRKK